MSEHAILSASGAHRWMECTPSARLERECKDTSGEAAAEGSAAHALAEHKLRCALDMPSSRPVSPYDGDEMENHTTDYVVFIMEQLTQARQACEDPLVLIEHRLDFSRYVPDGFGTGDCVIIADGVLHIVDFKYGQGVLVEVQDNPQMMLYALGALDLFDSIYDISTVAMTIYQPRRENVSTHTVFKESLYQWAEDVLRPAADKAYKGEGDYVPGDHCQFCRAAVKCRARADENLKLAAFDFALPPLLTDGEIAEVLASLNRLKAWANEVMAYATDAAVNHGKKWPGFKVVMSRSNRRFTDDAAVAAKAIAAGYDDIYEQSLLPITGFERLMGKAKFQEILGGLVTKPPGKPTLVSVSDTRPSIGKSANDDFKEEP